MKPRKRASNRFILPVGKVKKAKEILAAETETEAVERALDLIIAGEEIRRTLQSIKAACDIEDIYGRFSQ